MRGEEFYLLVTAVVCCLKSNMVDLKEIGLNTTYMKCVSVFLLLSIRIFPFMLSIVLYFK